MPVDNANKMILFHSGKTANQSMSGCSGIHWYTGAAQRMYLKVAGAEGDL